MRSSSMDSFSEARRLVKSATVPNSSGILLHRLVDNLAEGSLVEAEVAHWGCCWVDPSTRRGSAVTGMGMQCRHVGVRDHGNDQHSICY
jgi:hypothetical protein